MVLDWLKQGGTIFAIIQMLDKYFIYLDLAWRSFGVSVLNRFGDLEKMKEMIGIQWTKLVG